MPYRVIDGHAASTMSAVMPASVSGTMSASPVTPPAKIRSPRPERMWLVRRKHGRAAARDRVDLGLGLRQYVRRQRRVAEVLREGLAFMSAPPEVARHRQSFGVVGDVLVGEEEGERGDGPCVGIR